MRRSVLFATAVTAAVLVLSADRAFAGPVEVLTSLSISPTDPSVMALRYQWGGGGLFLSNDAGKHFRLLCNSAVDPSLSRDASGMLVQADGSLLIGVFDGMWSGDANGCHWSKPSAFNDLWVNDFAIDPLDAKTSYLITSSGGKQNGLYEHLDTSSSWKPYGSQAEILINRVFVVPTSAGKTRIYLSAVNGMYSMADPNGGAPIMLPQYVIRTSEDDGKTWKEQLFAKTDGSMRMVAVNPANPDQIVVAVIREDDMLKDDLLYSTSAGSAGSFKMIGQVTAFGGASFAPDGTLFYGDIDQTTPALYSLAHLGGIPKLLSDKYKAGCVSYEPRTKKLYVCQDRLFGTADPKSGAFTQLFDITKADEFVDCPGEPPTRDRCAAQLAAAYCGITHYPAAPICASYGLVDAGAGQPKPDGGAGLSDSGAQQNAAGSHGGSAGSAGANHSSSGGSCSSVAVGARRNLPASVLLAACMLAAALLRRRKLRAVTAAHSS